MADTEFKKAIRKSHWQAEVLRLCQGMEGCGCSLCQELYRTLDMAKYGSRVICSDGYITIREGREGADITDPTDGDGWKENQGIFVCCGTSYVLRGNGRTVALPPKRLEQPPETPPKQSGGVLQPSTNCANGPAGSRRGQRVVTPAVTVQKIKELSLQGLSSRSIAKQLTLEDFEVSYRTCARMVKA